jgi:erythronate-4-phosphate dehydrogenase
VVDNAALSALLARGGGPDVVLDVWENEPVISRELLRQVQFGTPHIAGYSLDGKLLATRMLIEAMALDLGLPWCDPGGAAAEPAPLRVAGNSSAAGLVRDILGQRYDIRADDAALRAATLEVDSQTAAVAFDRLRRHYPQRREVLGSHVAPGQLSVQDRRLLAGLGCALDGVACR